MNLSHILRDFSEDLAEVEQDLERALEAPQPLLRESAQHLLKAGGKRLRPLLVLVAGRFGRYDLARLKPIAVALELIHLATLVHDDVIDDAQLRRGRPTVRAKWGDALAMYTGDYIFARSLQVATEVECPRIHQVLSQAVVDMCIGEMVQIRDFFNVHLGLRDYLRRIKRKTALLMAVSAQLGAMAAEAPAQVVRALRAYGHNVGMAFQITDDILDYTGTEETLGKPVGSDLKQGIVTLPALYALATSPRAGVLREWIATQRVADHLPEALAIVRDSGGIAFAKELAARYLNRALEALRILPDVPARRTLEAIARFVGHRSY
ncbi:polyprenyl synthetase family protein [Calditerricola satsumensis]|uniref:Heptaprenyl diphosphate synthase component 2 n=1 Tax=Calditerricola satsumensis TaxID=373054 RepID=A0A8J3B8W5_9BACI|nr:polyprenyl synthetase family protein [Calditerricola satsumensis]GGJ93907.1 heptaprenyl diphosphate synthase component 2 [Calditerricola satsumensis]